LVAKSRRNVTILLDDQQITNLDKLCDKLDWNRSQLLRGIISGDDMKIDLIAAKAKELNKLF
jgi:transcriptional accessory protein Tex/SPT6